MSKPKIKVYNIGDDVFECPYWSLLPLLSEKETKDLRESIETKGIKTALTVVWVEQNRYLVIDGANRVGEAWAADLPRDQVPLNVIGKKSDYTEEQLEELAVELNLKRRHLTPAQRQDWARKLRKKGKSTRQIAEQLGTTQSTVARDLKTGESFGSPGEVSTGKVTGNDGKVYPEKTKASPKPKPPPEEREEGQCYHGGCKKKAFSKWLYCVEHQAIRACAICDDAGINPARGKPCMYSGEPWHEAGKTAKGMLKVEPSKPIAETPTTNEIPESEVEASGELARKALPPQPKEEARDALASRAVYVATAEINRQAKHASIAKEAWDAHQEGQLGPFSVLLVDPPWRYDAKISESKAIENHYPTLSLDDLCALDVSSLCAPKAVLYLWVTAPMALAAGRLIDAWGFVYKTQHCWVKEHKSPGMGHWVRGEHELLYVCTKGAFPTPPTDSRDRSVLWSPRGAHSVKPVEMRRLIEEMYPDHPKVEIFAREKVMGWTPIGNAIDGADVRELLRAGVDRRQRVLPLEVKPSLPAAPQEEVPEPTVEPKEQPAIEETKEEEAPTHPRLQRLHAELSAWCAGQQLAGYDVGVFVPRSDKPMSAVKACTKLDDQWCYHYSKRDEQKNLWDEYFMVGSVIGDISICVVKSTKKELPSRDNVKQKTLPKGANRCAQKSGSRQCENPTAKPGKLCLNHSAKKAEKARVGR